MVDFNSADRARQYLDKFGHIFQNKNDFEEHMNQLQQAEADAAKKNSGRLVFVLTALHGSNFNFLKEAETQAAVREETEKSYCVRRVLVVFANKNKESDNMKSVESVRAEFAKSKRNFIPKVVEKQYIPYLLVEFTSERVASKHC